MHTSLDELDLQLLNTLQEFPRISWTDAAQVLGLSAKAVSARWRRLTAQGIAWIAVHPNPVSPDYVTAIVELGCMPARRAELVDRLVLDGRIVSLEEPSRGSHILLTAMVANIPALSQLLLDDLTSCPEVVSMNSMIVVNTFGTGGDWRIGALDDRQLQLIRRRRTETHDRRAHRNHLPTDAARLAEALLADGRLSVADIARTVGENPATVRRHLAALLVTDRLSFRCDLNHTTVGLPITATYFVRVSHQDLQRAKAALRGISRLRVGVQVTGEANLIFSVLSRSMSDLAAFDESLAKHVPWIDVVDSLVLLRSRKRMGWLLDPQGRRTEDHVPPTVLQHLLV